jgi:hypothetical protein
LREGLALWRELGDQLGAAECLEGLAAIAAGTGEPARVARLLGAVEALREAMGTPQPPVERLDHEATVAATRAALGAAAFAAAWSEGQALTPEEAVAYALADEPEPAPAVDDQVEPGRLGAY